MLGSRQNSRPFRSRSLPILCDLARSDERARRPAAPATGKRAKSGRSGPKSANFKGQNRLHRLRTHAGQDPIVSDIDPVLVCHRSSQFRAVERPRRVNPLHPPGRRVDFDRSRSTAGGSSRVHLGRREIPRRARHRMNRVYGCSQRGGTSDVIGGAARLRYDCAISRRKVSCYWNRERGA